MPPTISVTVGSFVLAAALVPPDVPELPALLDVLDPPQAATPMASAATPAATTALRGVCLYMVVPPYRQSGCGCVQVRWRRDGQLRARSALMLARQASSRRSSQP